MKYRKTHKKSLDKSNNNYLVFTNFVSDQLKSMFYYIKKIYLHLEWTPFKKFRESLPIFAKISGWFVVIKHLGLQGGILYVSNYLQYNLQKIIIMNYQDINSSLENLPRANQYNQISDNNYWQSFENKILESIPYLLANIIIDVVNSVTNKYLINSLTRRLVEDINKIKFNNQISYGLSHNKDNNSISRVINLYTENYTDDSLKMMISAFTATQKAILSTAMLLSFSQRINIAGRVTFLLPDLVVLSASYGYITQFISGIISTKKTAYFDQLRQLTADYNIVKEHDNNNIKNITEQNAEQFTYNRHRNFRIKIAKIDDKILLVSSVQKLWQSVHTTANHLFKLWFIGRRIYHQTLASSNRGIAYNTLENTEPLFNWQEQNYDKVNWSEYSRKKINKFLNAKDELSLTKSALIFDDHQEQSLIIKNVTLKIGEDRLLVKIPSLELLMGKRYLITGDSGNGKSTLLTKIAGIIHTGQTKATGQIFEPFFNKKILKKIILTQNDYFPKNTSLLEIICFPDLLPINYTEKNHLIKKITQLFNQAKIDDLDQIQNAYNDQNKLTELIKTDAICDWDSRLSGGQKKKIRIISQVIKNPDILILDEAFTGLDIESIKVLQNMLRNYLPQALILVVDHHGANNNQLGKNKFYDEHLHFAEQKISNITLKAR